ncbi:hypothetical protein SAY86_016360 [Trapa natans]|uniref:Amino acid transporter transmembrane domain-containing protein n=1 Tax=Trapa natans TaxID=22666 RepID=A0AAN7LFX3_TRANT|nr:hypothetical protein SAY86_016360 [Trapa natans]
MAGSNRMTNVDSTSAQREMGGEGIEEEGVDDPNSSLIPSFDSSDSLLIRTGTKWTAVAHIISAVIGAGVLSLAWSVAQLGWIIGPLCIILFAAMTLVSSALLADCYRHPNPEHGPIRNRSFMDATKLYMGEYSIYPNVHKILLFFYLCSSKIVLGKRQSIITFFRDALFMLWSSVG